MNPPVNVAVIVSALACMKCGGAFTEKENVLMCSCGASYVVQDGRVYFDTPPEDFEQDGNGPNVERSNWGSWRAHNYEYFKQAFSSLPDSATVLDFGAGPSQFSELTRRFASLISMDFRAFAQVNVVADLTKSLPLKSGVFDVAMASNVFEHIPDTRALLLEIRRTLKEGGFLVATIPFLMRVHQKPYDFNRYTNFQWNALLIETGFEIIDLKGLSTPIEVYTTMQRHFFSIEIGKAHGLRKFVLRGFRLFESLRLRALSTIVSSERSDDYTEGYGFIARVK